jgi:hypothetical protein
MSQSYLEKYRSTLPKSQGDQLLKRLISKRDSGEIRTVDEFKERLKELTLELLEERIKPSLALYKAVGGEDTSSAQFNEMLERIEDDLETAFTEADNLDEIIAAHHNLISQVSLKSLRYGVNELESRVSFYEFINKNELGFDDALFNTFREAQGISISRNNEAAALVFIDPKTGATIASIEDAEVDLVGERLTLGPDILTYTEPRNVTWLTNEYSQHGEVDVRLPNSNIYNLIDGQQNTYWIVPVLHSKVQPGGSFVEICLHLPSTQDINFVEIEPAADFPMVLAQVDYMDPSGIRRTASSGEVTVSGPIKAYFSRITTASLILRFRQDNYREAQFSEKPGTSNFHRAVLGEKLIEIDLSSASKDLQEMLTSDFVLSDVMGVSTNTSSISKYYQYTFGFDNIRPGYSTFDERSIFVSKKVTVKEPGQVGLKVDEVRPTQAAGSYIIQPASFTYPSRTTTEDDKFYHGSVEYWLAVKSYSEGDFLIATDIVPIFPLAAQRVYHERVVFTKKTSSALSANNMASLMFFTDEDATDVKGYRNGVLLTQGSTGHWDFIASDEDSEMTQPLSDAGSRMKRGIKINGTVNPVDIYTFSYTPKLSTTRVSSSVSGLLEVVDLTGDLGIRMIADNVVIFNGTRRSYPVAKVDIYLIIIFRRNSARLDVTPAVEEYLLATSIRNAGKFVSDS